MVAAVKADDRQATPTCRINVRNMNVAIPVALTALWRFCVEN